MEVFLGALLVRVRLLLGLSREEGWVLRLGFQGSVLFVVLGMDEGYEITLASPDDLTSGSVGISRIFDRGVAVCQTASCRLHQ